MRSGRILIAAFAAVAGLMTMDERAAGEGRGGDAYIDDAGDPTAEARDTPDRLLIWHDEAWWSVWLGAVVGAAVDGRSCTLDLFFDGEPPYRFAGSHALVLAVILHHLLGDDRRAMRAVITPEIARA